MAKSRIIAGLEIGTSKVCVTVCESKRDGSLRILGVGQTDSRGVRKGELVDFGTASICIKEAVAEAEEKADVEIGRVYLAVSGGHISGVNNRGCVTIPEERPEIDEADCEDVVLNARDISLPPHHTILHAVLKGYRVDGQGDILTPIGMFGRKLEADFHIVHATQNRIKTAIRCVNELGLEVEDVVFSGLAAAQVVLSQHQKEQGALLLDLGGGTTEFVLYSNGAIEQCGVLPVGGDHVTNDISRGLGISSHEAEKLKIQEGSVHIDMDGLSPSIHVHDEGGFAGITVDMSVLNTIIRCRTQETLELISRFVNWQDALAPSGAAVFLTGQGSRLKGIAELTGELFGKTVRLSPWTGEVPSGGLSENPSFSVALGLIKYAIAAVPPPKQDLFGWFRQLWNP